jgi:hypothetical protein
MKINIAYKPSTATYLPLLANGGAYRKNGRIKLYEAPGVSL